MIGFLGVERIYSRLGKIQLKYKLSTQCSIFFSEFVSNKAIDQIGIVTNNHNKSDSFTIFSFGLFCD